MKLAIDCRLIGQSGIGTYIENIVRHVVKDVDNTFLLIGDRRQLERYAVLENCEVADCTLPPFSPKELFAFPTAEVNRCDAFFSPNFNLPFGIQKPIFCTIHDVVFFDVPGICSPIGKLIRRIYIKRALRLSRAVFTVSDFSRRRITQLFDYRRPITIVPNGISQQLIEWREDHREQPRDQGNYIVCLGNLKKYKGVRDLIMAYNQARRNAAIDYRLVVVGRIDLRTKDDDLIAMLSEADNEIEFITDADNNRVYELLASAKALVSPSHYEGFGIPPLEAMFLGTPAIVSDIPTHQEVYRHTPATFFRMGDIDHLATTLAALPSQRCDIDHIVSQQYNYEIAARKIVDTIAASLADKS